MADITDAFLRGHQAGQQEKQHNDVMEQNKLHSMILKHQMDAIKIENLLREQEIAKNQAGLSSGQPASSFFSKIPTAPPGAMGEGISFGNQPAPEVVPTGPEPIQIPGLPGAAPQSITPQTLEQQTRLRQQAELDKAFAVQLAKGPQLHNVPAGTSVIDEANPSAGPVYTSPSAPSSSQPLERQLDAALAAGDTATAERILKTMKLAAQAQSTSDPAAKAQMAAIDLQLKQLQLTAAQNKPDLSPTTQRQVATIARTFDTLPVVKRAQLASESVGFVQGLDINTKNPADDIGLIYAFAKAMDPDSVVREGEYATVQRYAQTWAESFRFNAQRIFSNTAFLTPEARKNMRSTIETKFKASQKQYDAVRQSYGSKIDKLAGTKDGASYLTDYGQAFPTAGPSAVSATTPPQYAVGQTVQVKGQKIKITAIHPDGTFDGEPVK